MALVVNLAIVVYFICFTSTKIVLGSKPNFTSEPDKMMVAYQEEAVNFTWKISNHSFNTLYFGTWYAKHGTLDNTIISIVRNGSKFSIYTSKKEEVKEYRGRVRWTGDLGTGVASFELINIKQTDQKYYGVEIEFDDDMMTEVSGFTQLSVKSRSFFTSAPSGTTKPAHGSAFFTWRYSLAEEDQNKLSALVFGVYKKDTYGKLCRIEIKEKVVSSSNCSTDKVDVRFTSTSPTSMARFVLDNLSPDDEGVYSLRLEGTREPMENKTRLLVKGTKPHFTSEPGKLIVRYQEETANFTWKLSNHSINRVDFGTWRGNYGTLGNTIISIVRNGSKFSIYTSKKEEVKEYRGRVRWTGDLRTGVASFELTNIKQTDQKHYGVEIEFVDDMMTEVSGFTQLVVKSRSFFKSAPSGTTQPVHGSAFFTWRYSLTEEDHIKLSALVFGVYKKHTYGTLCRIEIKEKVVSSFNCSTGKVNVRFTSTSPTSMARFVLDNLSPDDEGVYSLRLEGTREPMENKTRLLVKGIKPHFTSEPGKLIEVYQEETVKFTWKLSNHSINRVDFGTWRGNYGTLGNTIMSIVRNGSEFSIYTSAKEEVKKYRGRVRWAGDLRTGVASFKLINIKQTDQKYYGVEIEFNDDFMTEVCGFTKLVIKTKSVVVKETNPCELNNGECSDVCVFSSVTKAHTCKCPRGMDLSSDGKTCEMVFVSTSTFQPTRRTYSPASGADIYKGPAVKVFLSVVMVSIIVAL